MILDAWMPVGFKVNDINSIRRIKFEGVDWQIYELNDSRNILIANDAILAKWLKHGFVNKDIFQKINFGSEIFFYYIADLNKELRPLSYVSNTGSHISFCKPPANSDELNNISFAIKHTRELNAELSLHDGIYSEDLAIILPIFSISKSVTDDVVFGSWVTGGVPVSINSKRRILSLTNNFTSSELDIAIAKSGLKLSRSENTAPSIIHSPDKNLKFTLPGRPYLENFFNEHIIDILQNPDTYKALGIEFPSAIILHGPPGCGKTFAVEKLVEYLNWPSFQIDSSSVGSSYIHGTSKKVAEMFDIAIKNAPSILVIDEMESFLADREMGSGSSHHRVEEVAEFLRRIPEAIKNKVLIIAMTNRISMIDPAIRRRGRFDHIIEVNMASEAEVYSLLKNELGKLPCSKDVDLKILAHELQGRPLSDITFTIREAARLAAKTRSSSITQDLLLKALNSTFSRDSERE
jgi:DNA-binding Lrp family transcriptional regulator